MQAKNPGSERQMMHDFDAFLLAGLMKYTSEQQKMSESHVWNMREGDLRGWQK
jgi:hypothetical protein